MANKTVVIGFRINAELKAKVAQILAENGQVLSEVLTRVCEDIVENGGFRRAGVGPRPGTDPQVVAYIAAMRKASGQG